MQIGLLGDLQVLDDDDKDIVITGAKLRALLVMLALQCGRAVPAIERLRRSRRDTDRLETLLQLL